MVLNFLKSSYKKLKEVFTKAGSLLGQKLSALFAMGRLDAEALEQLEQLLYEADLGLPVAQALTEKIKNYVARAPQANTEELLNVIKEEILKILNQYPTELKVIPKENHPIVILIVGVNGNGKTTSVAKLARYFQQTGLKVLIGAGDTFRAAAIDQLEIWTQRLGVEIVKGNPKSDPASVAYDTVTAGKARNADLVLLDTAGRLHTKTDLMKELEKIRRSCSKVHPSSPHETLLVLDATTGQNAVDQAKIFNQFTPITGLILTKLDGTAKGGIVVSITQQLGIPVKFIGLGEGVEDLEPFNPETFVQALFGNS